MLTNDTIAAIATPLGVGGVGIIRLSGGDAKKIAETLLPICLETPRYAYFSDIFDPKTNTVIDQGLCLFFQENHSFTGEDVVEFQCHGGPYILKSVLQACLDQGARLASGGEFSKRAFINGKIDLTKAESIIDLIHSKTESAHAVALHHLKGHLFKQIQSIRQSLLRILEEIEGSIDFPDEVPSLDRTKTKQDCQGWCETLKSIIDLKDYGRHINQGVSVLLIGRPNVGKSSLFNAFLGEERAIVTDIAGTTRDFIDAELTLSGQLYRLIDTAGVRESDDYIEFLGQKKSHQLIESADVILWVVDGTQALTSDDELVYKTIKHKDVVYQVINKSDEKQQITSSTEDRLSFNVSAHDQHSLESIKNQLIEDFATRLDQVDKNFICNLRQTQCISQAYEDLLQFSQQLDERIEDDVLSLHIRKSIAELGEVTGDDITEEMLDGVFSRFCVGK